MHDLFNNNILMMFILFFNIENNFVVHRYIKTLKKVMFFVDFY